MFFLDGDLFLAKKKMVFLSAELVYIDLFNKTTHTKKALDMKNKLN